MKPPPARTGADRCPGALQPFAAEDGLIVRARVPGGELAIAALQQLMALALEHGTGRIQLTTRGNLQIRGLADPAPNAVAERMADAGFLPSLTHERARNILAAPTSRRLRERARELDRALQRRPALAALPGRFLMLLTDDTGLGLSEPYDVAFVELRDASDPGASPRDETTGLILAAGRAKPCRSADALLQMLDLAERFLAERTDQRQWNIRDLPAESSLLAGFGPREGLPGPPLRPGSTLDSGAPGSVSPSEPSPPLEPGTYGDDLVAGIPLGLLEPRHLDAIASIGDTVVITPWRSVLIEGAARHAALLADAGLVTSPRSIWARISACTGAPHCGRAVSETMSLAAECADALPVDGPRLHLVGCERRCGHPRGEHVTVIGARSVADVERAEREGRR